MFCAAEKDILQFLSTEDLVAKFATAADCRLDLGQTDGVHVRPAVMQYTTCMRAESVLCVSHQINILYMTNGMHLQVYGGYKSLLVNFQ